MASRILNKVKPWKRANGLLCATLTPMHKDGLINYDMVDKYVDHLVSNNVKQVFVNGSSGEHALLSLDERKKLAEKWVQSGKGKLDSIVVQCGTGNLVETSELAAHAQSIGVDCVAAIAPTYYPAQNTEALVTYMVEVAKACQDTPFMYYHYPALTGIPFRLCEFLRAASGRIPNLIGAKFSSADLVDAALALQVDNFKFDVVTGSERLLVSALAMGVNSFIGIGFSILGKPCDRIYNNFRAGKFDEALKEQYMVQQFFECTHTANMSEYVASVKACMGMIGMDFGSPRLPIQDLSDERKEAIKKQLEVLGFFEWLKR